MADDPPASAAATSGARKKGPTAVARAYFAALADRDVDAAAAMWEPGSTDRFVGMADLLVPSEFKRWFHRLFDAFTDFRFEVVTLAATKEHVAVRWRASGTFDGTAQFEGMNPNGARIEVEGCDMLTVRDGKIVENFAYMNGADLARQLGAMPPQGSVAERGMIAAVNAKTAAVEAVRGLRERSR